MIKSLDISNFKSFAADVPPMPLAPITLVYGPNSAGKSTLLQTLALLKQSLEPRVLSSAGVPDLVFTGDYVDLGGFLSTVYRHDRDKCIGLGLSFIDPSPEGDSRLLADEPIFVGLQFGWDGGQGRSVQRLATLGDSDDRVSFNRNAAGNFELASGEADPAAFVKLIRSREQIHRDAGNSEDKREADNLKLLASKTESLLQDGDRRLQFLSTGLFPGLPEPGFIQDWRLDLNLGLWFEEYLYARARAVTEVLSNLAYLGPLRSLPTRFQLLAEGAAETVGFTGEHTARLLADNPQLQKAVDECLEDFEVPYRLKVLPLAATTAKADEMTLRPEIGNLVTIALVHLGSDVVATVRDVGFGVSQMLPVVVQLLVNTNSTICIEQPEVHIHPRLQADIADLLIESASSDGRANQVIVETHSEALMLRVQRRVAEGLITPDDVSVIYVDTDAEGRAAPRVLPLDDNGGFAAPWPGGFFTERLDDQFARSARFRASAGRPPSKSALEALGLADDED